MSHRSWRTKDSLWNSFSFTSGRIVRNLVKKMNDPFQRYHCITRWKLVRMTVCFTHDGIGLWRIGTALNKQHYLIDYSDTSRKVVNAIWTFHVPLWSSYVENHWRTVSHNKQLVLRKWVKIWTTLLMIIWTPFGSRSTVDSLVNAWLCRKSPNKAVLEKLRRGKLEETEKNDLQSTTPWLAIQ